MQNTVLDVHFIQHQSQSIDSQCLSTYFEFHTVTTCVHVVPSAVERTTASEYTIAKHHDRYAIKSNPPNQINGNFGSEQV